MDEGRPSVRVEVSELDAAPLEPPVPQRAASNRAQGLFAGVGVLAVLAGLVATLVLLQPESGENAVGAVRESTTSAPSTTTAPSTTVASTTSALSDDTSDAALPAESFPESIVRTNDGFLMLMTMNNGGFGLWRSADGTNWTAADFTIDNAAVDEPSDESTSWARYTGLISTPDGFAMLEMREGRAREVFRLTSTDGERWRREPVSLSPEEGWMHPLVHSPDAVLMQSYRGTGRDETVALFRTVLRPDSDLDLTDVCHVNVQRELLEMYACTFDGEPSRIESDDLINPEIFDDVVECALSISASGHEDFTFWSIDAHNRVSSELDPGLLLWQGEALPGTTTVVTVDIEQPKLDVAPACDGLADLSQQDDDLPTAVVLIEPDGSSRRIDMPNPVEAQLLWTDEDWAPPVVSTASNGAVHLAANGKVWKLDLESLVWQEILSIPEDTIPRFSRDGGVVLVIAEQGVDVGDLTTGEWHTVEADDAHNSWPIYIDDEVVIFDASERRAQTVAVSLSPS